MGVFPFYYRCIMSLIGMVLLPTKFLFTSLFGILKNNRFNNSINFVDDWNDEF